MDVVVVVVISLWAHLGDLACNDDINNKHLQNIIHPYYVERVTK